MSTASAYGLDVHARAMCPLYHASLSPQDCHHFLVGTASPSTENKIHVIEYQEDTKSMECATVWSRNDPVTGLWCSPSLSDTTLVAATTAESLEILRLSDNVADEPRSVAVVKKSFSRILWDLDGLQKDCKAIQQNVLSTISLEGSSVGKETVNYTAEGGKIRCAAMAPYDPTLCMLSSDTEGLQLVDLRAKKSTALLNTKYSHGFGYVTALDFNRANPGQFMSAGTDGCMAVHDIRYNTTCDVTTVREMKAHEHTINGCLFNPFHDELVLSCSSDQTLKLWDVEHGGEAKCIRRLADYGDSVVSLCWSSSSPWVFAGLSYNGKLLVDTVPSGKKMSILLDEKK